MAVAQLVWEQDCPSESRATTGARAGSVPAEGQTKRPFPHSRCTQSPGLQELLRAGGSSTSWPLWPLPSLTPAILFAPRER